ncbi:DinB family protein [Bacillus coreaensis]
MEMVSVNHSIKSINQSIDEIIETVKGLPDDVIRWNPSEDEWSIMQILTHVVEATPYWLGEIEQILKDKNVEWGRGLQDEGRLAAVSSSRVENTLIEEVLKELKAVKPQIEQTLTKLNRDNINLEATSRNPRFGTKPISFIVDHLLVEHVNKHLGQIKRNLSKVNK